MKHRILKTIAAAGALAVAGTAGYTYRARAAAPEPGAATQPRGGADAAGGAPAAALPDFSAIVQRYGPAVVNVSTTATMKTAGQPSPFGQMDPNDPFYWFFRRFGVPEQQGQPTVRGLGSGFIVKADGVVLTNAHVVDGASEVKVKLTDKREFPAKVIGVDKSTDVAVLKIDARDLPTVRIGDASRLRVGQWVLAIGSPFGFDNSATAGIVSAR